MLSLSEVPLPQALGIVQVVVKVLLEAVAGLAWRISCFHKASLGFDFVDAPVLASTLLQKGKQGILPCSCSAPRQEADQGTADADAVA